MSLPPPSLTASSLPKRRRGRRRSSRRRRIGAEEGGGVAEEARARNRRRGRGRGFVWHVLLLVVMTVALMLERAEGFAAVPPAAAGKSSNGDRGKGGGKNSRKGSRQHQDEDKGNNDQKEGSAGVRPNVISITKAKSAREAAYLAALGAERDQMFISDALQEWSKATNPSSSEMGFATLVANVACREAASLDYAVKHLAGGGPIRLKARQRVVLRTALAQYKYCTRIPLYAIVDHAVELAKRHGGGAGSPHFARFTNAILRKLPGAEDGRENTSSSSSPSSSMLASSPKGKPKAKATRSTSQEERQEEELELTAIRPLPLPKDGNSVEALAATFSYPPYLVKLFLEDFGVQGARQVMKAGNAFPPTMVRSRGDKDDAADAPMDLTKMRGESEEDLRQEGAQRRVSEDPAERRFFEPLVTTEALPPALKLGKGYDDDDSFSSSSLFSYTVGVVRSDQLLKKLVTEAGWYVTNGTPAGLISRLAEGAYRRIRGDDKSRPLRALDVCAAPGGKGLALWDIIHKGQGHALTLTVNDVNADKKARIEENLVKYGLLPSPSSSESRVDITIGDGATMTKTSEEEGYDIVILDAPCSNAGVLSRRPEARWRLADDKLLKGLEDTQFSLLKNAKQLLSDTEPHAEIWYMTCSILSREDEKMVDRACKELGLEVVEVGHGKARRKLMMKVLPGEGGLGGAFDGGFGVALRRRETAFNRKV